MLPDEVAHRIGIQHVPGHSFHPSSGSRSWASCRRASAARKSAGSLASLRAAKKPSHIIGLRERITSPVCGSRRIWMKVFGEAGAGMLVAPTASVPDVTAHCKLVKLGESEEIREQFFLISAERRLIHPAAQAVSENAHSECSRRRSLPGEADGAGSVIARYAGGDFFQCCPGSCSLVGAGCRELRPLDLRCSAALASR